MQQTSNYVLNKPEQTDVVNIEDLNANFDTLDTELKKVSDKANLIQTAGGTGTAITLNNISLINGFTVTFVVAANNSGAATTINGKALYKPGGTSAPTLTAGKAVTVWYNGTNFFIKASAEGNSVAADVLAGKTFSNDADTGLVGTIASKSAATYNPSTSAQTIAAGQYLSGAQTLAATTGTSVAGDVLSGKTFNSANGIGLVGTMPNNGSVGTQSLASEGGEYTIPAGYHNGLGKVKAAITGLIASVIKAGTTVGGILGTFTADATATAANILSGKSAYVNGNKVTGSIPVNTPTTADIWDTIGLSTGNGVVHFQIDPNTYYQGINWVRKLDPNFVPANFLATVNVFGLQGGIPNYDEMVVQAVARPYMYEGGVYISPSPGYYNGNNWSRSWYPEPDILPQNILSGKNICAQAGTAKRVASGTGAPGGSGGINAPTLDGNSIGANECPISGLSFTPTLIIITKYWTNTYREVIVYKAGRNVFTSTVLKPNGEFVGGLVPRDIVINNPFHVSNGGFNAPSQLGWTTFDWTAIE